LKASQAKEQQLLSRNKSEGIKSFIADQQQVIIKQLRENKYGSNQRHDFYV
jgi:hypothetical protein